MQKILSFFVFLACLLTACSPPEKPKAPNTPLVLASIAPHAYLAQRIAGNTVEVTTLVPKGANPHLYEPTPKEVKRMHQAALWLCMGEPFEKKIITIFHEQHPSVTIANMCQGISLLPLEEGHHHDTTEHSDEERDRHIWLAPRLIKAQAQHIAKELTSLCPEHRLLYEKNLHAILSDLKVLDQEIASLLHPIKECAIVVSHPAFSYFCKEYGLLQLSVECEGKEPLPQHLVQLMSQAKQWKAVCVFLQPQYNNKGAELIAKELQLPLYDIDPYSFDCIATLDHLSKVIAQEALK